MINNKDIQKQNKNVDYKDKTNNEFSVNNNLDNGRSIEKQIAIVFLKTFSIILVLIFATIFYSCIFAPKAVSNFANELGMKKTSLYFAKIQYSRDKDINSLYSVINKSIAINSYDDIEKYIGKLFEYENYYDFILFIESENIARVVNDKNEPNKIPLMISFANEDMYLKNKYVQSLVVNDKINLAIEFSQKDLSLNSDEFVLGNRIYWSFTYLFNKNNELDFLDEELKNKIVLFTDNLYNCYLSNKEIFQDLTAVQQFDYFVLENTLKRIYTDMLRLKDKVVFDTLSYDEIIERIDILNNVEE